MLLLGMVSISFRHGLSIYTTSCMVAYAAIQGTVGNFEGANNHQDSLGVDGHYRGDGCDGT